MVKSKKRKNLANKGQHVPNIQEKRFPKSWVLLLLIIILLVIVYRMSTSQYFVEENQSSQVSITENIVKEEVNESEDLLKDNEVVAIDPDLWTKPTGGVYPDLSGRLDMRILCKLSEQRVYIYDGQELLYKMIVSTGLPEEEFQTPVGEFVIERERGDFFFNYALDEGALNYVSFKDHGVYLFHSVPVNEEKEVNIEEAEKLGQQVSHGCIRLSMPDAKWFYDNIPEGVPVIIEE